jgi:hypothetical protein
MLCEKCAQREATVHVTYTTQGKCVRQNFCEMCGDLAFEEYSGALGGQRHPRPTIAEVAKGDPRYKQMAYKFFVEAVGYAVEIKENPRRRSPGVGVTAKELADVLRLLAGC